MIDPSDSSKTNRLIRSTSPYLLQHAHNPVDWYEWGSEALSRARAEDKPILISIGYSSCHWCHVMERESFENEDVARLMNENFVCIKVDREERPDIDQIYMEAVQAMQQHGGWPLNVFLTPEQKPFYGGTYFPPGNWVHLLTQINKAFKEKRKEINASAEDICIHLQTGDLQRFAKKAGQVFKRESLDNMFRIISSKFDHAWGGLDKAPKFVMPTIWLFLLRYYSMTKTTDALNMVTSTLSKMIMGGLYDQVGGGFSRYSVDREWFAPHFEKMLYDNAQLLSLYAEAYANTSDESFKSTVHETVGWLTREMMHPEGGVYSALDADSEGVEGKFYTWTWDELSNTLPKDSLTQKYFSATREGNWEHGRNILTRAMSEDQFLNEYTISKDDLAAQLLRDKKILLEVRDKRIHPGLDDKVLTGWNAMLIKGLIDACRAFSDGSYLDLALKNISFIERHLIGGGKVYRAFKNKHSETEGFLEDYAFLIQAYSALYQATFNEEWLSKAGHWTNYVLLNFYDEKEGYFHFSSLSAEKLIAQRKEIFDNVIPASNSVMTRNLYHLGILLDNEEWKRKAEDLTSRLASIIEAEPGYMSNWGILMSEIINGMAEVVISGPDAKKLMRELHQHYLPHTLTLGTWTSSKLSLLQGRESKDGTTKIYVCFDKTCKLPVGSVREALGQLSRLGIDGR